MHSFNKKLDEYEQIVNMELCELVACLPISEREVSQDELNFRIRNFDEIADKKADLDFISNLVRISEKNTFLFHFIQKEALAINV